MTCYIIASNTEMCLPRINPSNKWKLLFDLKVNRLFTSPLQYEKKPFSCHPKLGVLIK